MQIWDYRSPRSPKALIRIGRWIFRFDLWKNVSIENPKKTESNKSKVSMFFVIVFYAFGCMVQNPLRRDLDKKLKLELIHFCVFYNFLFWVSPSLLEEATFLILYEWHETSLFHSPPSLPLSLQNCFKCDPRLFKSNINGTHFSSLFEVWVNDSCFKPAASSNSSSPSSSSWCPVKRDSPHLPSFFVLLIPLFSVEYLHNARAQTRILSPHSFFCRQVCGLPSLASPSLRGMMEEKEVEAREIDVVDDAGKCIHSHFVANHPWLWEINVIFTDKKMRPKESRLKTCWKLLLPSPHVNVNKSLDTYMILRSCGRSLVVEGWGGGDN